MRLHSAKTEEIHRDLFEQYKEKLEEIEQDADEGDTEREDSFTRSFLHNAIYLHNMWFEQLQADREAGETDSPMLEDILERRESDINTFKEWMNKFAKEAQPHGWASWGWSNPLKTFVGFPIKGHDEFVPLGETTKLIQPARPILVIDCWEHSYMLDFGNDFEQYLEQFWRELDYNRVETRHQELAGLLGFDIK